MFSTLAILSVLTVGIFADSGSNPLVPSGISDSCTKFLTSLDGNSNMGACTSSLISATKTYGPGGNATASQSGISNTLSNLCGTSTEGDCPDSLIRSTLANFQAACSDELTANPNDAVVRMYDVLYALSPLRSAICTKDDDGSWCLMKSTSNSSSSTGSVNLASQNDINPADVDKYLYVQVPKLKRDDVTEAIYPNTTTFCSTNLAFTFIQPSLAQDSLCTACTRKIITSYTAFETLVPYAPGLGQSQILCGQSTLIKSVKSTCGTDFLSSGTGAVAAGSLSGSTLGTSASVQLSVNIKGVLASITGAVTLVFWSIN